MSKHKSDDEMKKQYISRDQVLELNEKHGWFQFGDAQSSVSNAFANEAIEKYERLRDAAPELLEALKLGLEYWQDRQQRYSNRSPVWVQQARAAIAKATGGEE